LRVVLKHECKNTFCTFQSLKLGLIRKKTDEVKTYNKHLDDEHEVNVLMVAIMDGELQKIFLQNTSYFIMSRLKEMLKPQARFERHKVTIDLIFCKMQEESSVSAYVLKMMRMIVQL
jgi:gag-polypeptide of LTR copia-type